LRNIGRPSGDGAVAAVVRAGPAFAIALLLNACAAAESVGVETRSIVSAADLPGSRYRNIVVFVQDANENVKADAERVVALALHDAGANAQPEAVVFKNATLTAQQKAQTVQREFDAVLYVNIGQSGSAQQPLNNVKHDAEYVYYVNQIGVATFTRATAISDDTSKSLILEPDGSVDQAMLALDVEADLQDAKSAKGVWTSQTIASAPINLTDMASLFGQAAQKIVLKMKADGVI